MPAILENPANWVIVFLILWLVSMLAYIVTQNAAGAPIQIPGINFGSTK